MSKPLRVHAEFSTFSLRTLPPALALADLYSREDSSRPDENDLDIEPQQVAGVALAFERLGVERPPPLLTIARCRSTANSAFFRRDA